jgi:hypothetical protein
MAWPNAMEELIKHRLEDDDDDSGFVERMAERFAQPEPRCDR